MAFWTYMLLCSDGKYYVGHSDNLELRIAQHQSGALGGYTATRRPVTLLWSEYFQTRLEALAIERQLKGWSREKKAALVTADWKLVSALARNRQSREIE